MSCSMNVNEKDGGFRCPPVVLREEPGTKMGPKTCPEHEWCAQVDHAAAAFSCSKKQFNEAWVAQKDSCWSSRKDLHTRHKDIDKAPELFRDIYWFFMERDGQIPGTLTLKSEVFDGDAASTAASTGSMAGRIPDTDVYVVHFCQLPEPMPRDQQPRHAYRYMVFSQSTTDPFGKQWAVPLYNGDFLTMNAACYDASTGVHNRFPAADPVGQSGIRSIVLTLAFIADPDPGPLAKRQRSDDESCSDRSDTGADDISCEACGFEDAPFTIEPESHICDICLESGEA